MSEQSDVPLRVVGQRVVRVDAGDPDHPLGLGRIEPRIAEHRLHMVERPDQLR